MGEAYPTPREDPDPTGMALWGGGGNRDKRREGEWPPREAREGGRRNSAPPGPTELKISASERWAPPLRRERVCFYPRLPLHHDMPRLVNLT